jgi:hypothetical protein
MVVKPQIAKPSQLRYVLSNKPAREYSNRGTFKASMARMIHSEFFGSVGVKGCKIDEWSQPLAKFMLVELTSVNAFVRQYRYYQRYDHKACCRLAASSCDEDLVVVEKG